MNKKHYFIDLKYLKEASDNVDFMLKIFEIFKSELPKIERRMYKAVKENNWHSLSQVAHKSKSSVSILGMHEDSADMLSLEIDAKNENNTDSFKERIDIFIQNYKNAVKEIEAIERELTIEK